MDFYGTSKLIFSNSLLPLYYKATWTHGIAPVFRKSVSSGILIYYNERHLPIHLVNNEKTVEILGDQGVKFSQDGLQNMSQV